MEHQIGERVIPIAVEDEVKKSYLTYAMSVIVSRALPDVRDGLKPVHRRILYGMHEMGLRSDKPFKKAARIVGDVLGKYHPHGDQSVYDALVRLAQGFSMRYPVVNGQGNFGSVDGDPPAAMRYTEARLYRVAEEILRDIDKDTIDFAPNYDDSGKEPLILPTTFPYLLVNGAVGIAVGMATAIPPCNLREITAAIIAVIDNPEMTSNELLKYVKGPDFPTGGIIHGVNGIRDAFTTGKGKISVRARFVIEQNTKSKRARDVIVINEIPYMVNKADLVASIAALVHHKKIDGIDDLRDESDRDGMRIVIELKAAANTNIVLNQLFARTQLQANFNVNSLALVKGKPKVLTLKEMISEFIKHRHIVVVRRSKYELKKAEEREHILSGLKVAIENIDKVIQIIKISPDTNTAKSKLIDAFVLSEKQAQAILEMRLQRLTNLETKKILEELQRIRQQIKELKELLGSEQKILNCVKKEVAEVAAKYGDERRTAIELDEIEELEIEDFIQKEEMVVLVSRHGYIKRLAFSLYKTQQRGGRGLNSSSNLHNDDFLEHLFIGSTHDYVLFFSNIGKVYFLKIHEIPQASRQAKGSHAKSLLQLEDKEEIASVVTLTSFSENIHILFATKKGKIARISAEAFVNARKKGIRAIQLLKDDNLVSVLLVDPEDNVLLVSKNGQGLRTKVERIRKTGRNTQGVRGQNLSSDDELAGVCIAPDGGKVLLLTKYGAGKRTKFSNIAIHNRGGKGMRIFSTTSKTGKLVAVLPVNDEEEFMAISSQGLTVKLKSENISVQGRTARGVRVMNIADNDYIVGVAKSRD